MGRSKFPGKPSKLASKKRIRILSSGQNGINITNCNEESPTNGVINGNTSSTSPPPPQSSSTAASSSSSSTTTPPCINQVCDSNNCPTEFFKINLVFKLKWDPHTHLLSHLTKRFDKLYTNRMVRRVDLTTTTSQPKQQ